ncbi:MAG: threonylcarbamoyl-AMP synthase [Hydrogenophilaceae bacterium]|jgi:L-threonylcarbamoyladenylate synthase|nr:threonylcarbamoyl-AMP synthase [Hydrogenophilaceae bacterium]
MRIAEAESGAIAEAAAILKRGGLVAMPTETVYGLAADAANARAVAHLFAVKGRPRFNPLIAHVRDLDAARMEAVLHPRAEELAGAFWPGPLTLVAPRAAGGRACDLACAGLSTIAVRAPAHDAAQALIAAFGGPIVAPSANRSGRVSPTTARHVAADLGADVDLILDGGPCRFGLESTIVAIGADGRGTLLRPGAIARGAIEAITGPLAAPSGAIEAPGMLSAHYAPRARLRLNAEAPDSDEVYLGFGAYAHGPHTLSQTGDLEEAAARLYAMLRALDATGAAAIAVAPVPAHGLGEAINDRLRRAAAQ